MGNHVPAQGNDGQPGPGDDAVQEPNSHGGSGAPAEPLTGPGSASGSAGSTGPASASGHDSAVQRAVVRSLEARRQSVANEVRGLVDAAFRLIERTGHLEPRVSEIVREAGLSNQAFYRHFRSKHELLVAVLDDGIRTLASYLDERMARAPEPQEAVREWLRGMLDQALHPRGAEATRPFVLARGRLAEAYPEEVLRSEAQLTEPLRAAIARAVTDGSMPFADPRADAQALYHLSMGWMQARLLGGLRPTAEDAAHLEAFAIAGLCRPKGVR